MTTDIRPATVADHEAIKALVRLAHLNPRNLDWRRFIVAEENRRVVGIGQVKHYPDGTRELASLVVLPEYHSWGIGRQLVEALLARETGPVYVMLDKKYAGSYTKYGFSPVFLEELPKDFAREFRIGRTITTIGSLFVGRRIRLVTLKRT